MFEQDTIRKGFRFCVVGGFVSGVDFTMLWVWSRIAPALVALSAAYVIAVAVHFGLNKWWVFQNRSGAYGTQLLKYVVTVIACWLCTAIVFSLALRMVTSNIYVAKLLALPPTTALGFILMKLFVFREKAV